MNLHNDEDTVSVLVLVIYYLLSNMSRTEFVPASFRFSCARAITCESQALHNADNKLSKFIIYLKCRRDPNTHLSSGSSGSTSSGVDQ